MNDLNQLLLTSQKALLLHIVPCLRSVSLSMLNHEVKWKCIFDHDATENDFELLKQAATEINAGFCGTEFILTETYEIVNFPEKMNMESHIVYHRHEHNYFD